MFVQKEVTLCLEDSNQPSFPAWVDKDKVSEDGICFPYFTWETANDIMRMFDNGDCRVCGYDSTHDKFVVSLPSDDAIVEFPSEIVKINGTSVQLFALTDGTWTWRIKE